MKFTAATLLVLTLCQQTLAQPGEVQQYPIEDFLNSTNYVGLAFSPGGDKLLVNSNASGIYNAYAIPVDGGPIVRLTHSTTNAIFASTYFPHDERFLFESDQGGNELRHTYLHTPDGQVTDLTPGDRHLAGFREWARDGQSFFVSSNERDERYFDTYEYDAQTYERTLIYQSRDGAEFGSISPDKRFVLLGRSNTNADSDILLFDRATQTTSLLTDFEGDVANSLFQVVRPFSPDGKAVHYITDKDSEFTYLVRQDLTTRKVEPVVQADWDVTHAYFSQNGTYLLVGINNDGRTEERLYEVATMRPLELPALVDANITSITMSGDEKLLAFYVSDSNMPGDIFVASLPDGTPRKLTTSLNPNIDPDDLVKGTTVRFASYDGLSIPGILYRPHQSSDAHRVPALVWVHGGPGGQSRVDYNPFIQFLANHGYAVYAINNRGSSGYGKTFYHLDDRRHGEADLDDVVASKKMLAATSFIDADRIGIIGASYGGYMVLAALAFRPTAFALGVDLYGISNWHRTLTNMPIWWAGWRAALEQEMGDLDNEEFLKGKSPLFFADRIVRPLIVLQGANDPRVLKIESDDIVKAVRANGVPVEYIVFDDEGHSFQKVENQVRAYNAILAFLDTHLRKQAR